ncbi:MAG: AAA family ATPase, partial [Asticcacaulis sp.]|nr:AAA family ATPase [Asticcacaulis sp.]
RAPGAVILRSDEIRKRLWACPEYEALPKDAYTSDENHRVYNEMLSLAETVAAAGQSVVLDATFREPQWRGRTEDIARQAKIPFRGIWLSVPAPERIARIAARTRDVSDATADVAERQQAVDPTTVSWHIEG